MNCYFVSRRLWLRDKSLVLTGVLGAFQPTFHSHRSSQLLSTPYPPPPLFSIFNGVKRTRMGRTVGDCQVTGWAINLSDGLCHLLRGQRANLSSCLETQIMILTKFRTHLGQKSCINDTEFFKSPFHSPLFCWIALETPKSSQQLGIYRVTVKAVCWLLWNFDFIKSSTWIFCFRRIIFL